MTDVGVTEETPVTHSVAWRPLGLVHELIWKISLMEEVEQSHPDVALSWDETRCQCPVCGIKALPSASHSDTIFQMCVLLKPGDKQKLIPQLDWLKVLWR